VSRKPLAIGIEDYKKIIEKPYYYVDKTLLIKDFIDKGGLVNLMTRPRRFGKTLALSMLRTFFEQEIDADGVVIDNRHYFDGMKIMEVGEEYIQYQGQYPVISMSLKSAKQPDFQLAYQMLEEQVAAEFQRHRYVLENQELLENEKKRFEALMTQRASRAEMASALKFLSDCLKKYHKKKVMILIDEYDVPLENAYFNGFYDEMIHFIRSFFESALKTNDSLESAVITGCLRISKESIFTGLNNLKILSLLSNQYAEYFGFTQEEVDQMLAYYGIQDRKDTVKKWYNGYLFGKREVYNPWSLINYVDDAAFGKEEFPKPYWSNTSSNSIVRELVEYADGGVKNEIETLIAGGMIQKPVHEDITYTDIYTSKDNLWNFLFFTGYLKTVSQKLESNTIYLKLAIPNEEVRYIYQNTIREWFDQEIQQTDFKIFYQSILSGDTEEMEEFICEQLSGSISYYDNAESFYHGYLLGILSGLSGYEILSNREAGNGRADLILAPFHPKKPAVILELKISKTFADMERMAEEALNQIEERNYACPLKKEGYQKIIKYGICFCKKSCMVKIAEE
jgi:hypothetical protein